MKLFVALVLCLSQVYSVKGAGGGYGYDWSYVKGPIGPSNWGQNYSACGHNSQSPINIKSGDATVDKSMGVLELHSYDQNASFLMKNRDTDIEFRATGQPKAIPQAVTWRGTKYRLFQLHFHWGLETHQGSEHQIDSQQYAAEMHIIHYNDKYDNVSQALDKADGLLVWGHFLQVTSETHIVNPYFKSLVGDFARVQTSQQSTNMDLNLKKLLPKVHDTYYHYTGSLTTPPCHESVMWIVSNNPIKVSENLMETEFRSLIDGPMTIVNNKQTQMGDNYRPIQNLNGRVVKANFDPTEVVQPKKCGASTVSKPFIGVAAGLLVALFVVFN